MAIQPLLIYCKQHGKMLRRPTSALNLNKHKQLITMISSTSYRLGMLCCKRVQQSQPSIGRASSIGRGRQLQQVLRQSIHYTTPQLFSDNDGDDKTKSSTSTASTSSTTSSSSSWVQTENSVVDSYDELRELRHDMTLLRLKKTIEQLQLRQQYHLDSTSTLRKDISEIEMENAKLMIQIQRYEQMEQWKQKEEEAEANPDNMIVC